MGKRIHIIMHAAFETPGYIETWAREQGHAVQFTHIYSGENLPEPQDCALLVLMGGPMDVNDDHTYPWLAEEKQWLADVISRDVPVLGICLGAQLIASSLGAEVYAGEHKEIGWHQLQYLPAFGSYMITPSLPAHHHVFHWHGDTFDIPEGATRIAASKATPNQGFIYAGRIIALQFHLEVEPANIRSMLDNCGDEIKEGPYMQSAEAIQKEKQHFDTNNELLAFILKYLLALSRAG